MIRRQDATKKEILLSSRSVSSGYARTFIMRFLVPTDKHCQPITSHKFYLSPRMTGLGLRPDRSRFPAYASSALMAIRTGSFSMPFQGSAIMLNTWVFFSHFILSRKSSEEAFADPTALTMGNTFFPEIMKYGVYIPVSLYHPPGSVILANISNSPQEAL